MKSRKILSLSAHFIKMTSIQSYYTLSIVYFLHRISKYKFLFNSQIPPTILDIIKYTCTLTAPRKQLLSEVCTVMKLILAMTATNATSERTFSALRRIKSYLRSKLMSLMALHVHKALADTIKLENIADEFVSSS